MKLQKDKQKKETKIMSNLIINFEPSDITRMKTVTLISVDEILTAGIQYCGLDFRIIIDSKKYGPRKEKWGEYVHTGDSVGVVMDTAKGELSFVLDGVNLGVAYEGIPLDKPLVPYVNIKPEGDSVELVI